MVPISAFEFISELPVIAFVTGVVIRRNHLWENSWKIVRPCQSPSPKRGLVLGEVTSKGNPPDLRWIKYWGVHV